MHFKYQPSLANHRKLYTFTLIELLVVVAIIGILASLLMPSLSKSREKARIAVCTNNQKQITTSTFMFMDDNEGYFPGDNSQTGVSWDDQLSTYDGRNLTDAQITGPAPNLGFFYWTVPGGKDHGPIYRCPLDDREDEMVDQNYVLRTYDITMYQIGTANLRGIAGFSGVNFVDGNWVFPPTSRKINEISSVAETISYTENHAPIDHPNEDRLRLGNAMLWSGLTPTITELNLAKHSDMKFNFAMADGHIEKMTYTHSMIRSDGTVASNADTADTKWDAEK